MLCFLPFCRLLAACLAEMEHTKKLILIDPKMWESLQSQREYKELEKPTDKKTKASMSVKLRELLKDDDDDDDGDMSDDVKAKIYQQTFSRFRSMQDKLPELHKGGVNALTTSVAARVLPQQQQQLLQRAAATPRRARTTPRQRQEPARFGNWLNY